MKHTIVYLDDYDYLNVDTFERTMIGLDAIKYINEHTKERAKKVLEDINGDKLVLKYENEIVDIKNYERVFSLYPESFKNLHTAHYTVSDDISNNVIKRKVTRKVKHVKAKIMATGLSVVIALGGASYVFASSNTSDDINAYNANDYISEDLEEEPINSFEEVDSIETENIIEEKEEEKQENNESVETKKEEQESQVIKEVVNNELISQIVDATVYKESISIDYEDRSFSEKAVFARENYSDIISYYANIYGVDPNLMLAIATQERGVHGEYMDEGGATGLMQIQNEVWDNSSLTAYNFEQGALETITVDPASLGDLSYNVKVGCMVFQNCLEATNYNILASVQTYNMGIGTIYNILNNYSLDSGKTVDEILADQTDTGWLSYTKYIPYGDPSYTKNVLSYLGEDKTVTVYTPENEAKTVNINNHVSSKKL